MLILKGITKDYTAGDTHVQALKGIDITFRAIPIQIIRIGPSAIFGRLFNTTTYGSSIRNRVSLHQRIIAINVPKMVAIAKPIIAS